MLFYSVLTSSTLFYCVLLVRTCHIAVVLESLLMKYAFNLNTRTPCVLSSTAVLLQYDTFFFFCRMVTCFSWSAFKVLCFSVTCQNSKHKKSSVKIQWDSKVFHLWNVSFLHFFLIENVLLSAFKWKWN